MARAAPPAAGAHGGALAEQAACLRLAELLKLTHDGAIMLLDDRPASRDRAGSAPEAFGNRG
eukprot:CAMPEP_0174722990 /NCGR_PEP_ID=MMETSP1094-20130205/39768_1 /TAXON_ID=156173 /ORGANISM="Chrysochromulina brevifilum, Strain UTEX LB 985" /LENGTH=61 /DNA_ID=CAMNT_0015923949 /DNA_START=352 /DNA_END=537 /DNA_ORIENTATION=-